MPAAGYKNWLLRVLSRLLFGELQEGAKDKVRNHRLLLHPSHLLDKENSFIISTQLGGNRRWVPPVHVNIQTNSSTPPYWPGKPVDPGTRIPSWFIPQATPHNLLVGKCVCFEFIFTVNYSSNISPTMYMD